MDYSEISNELVRLAKSAGMLVRTVETQGLRTTAVYVIPERWFVAFEPAGALFTGVYAPPDLRLVGTRQIPFIDLTLETLGSEFRSALAQLSLRENGED